MIHYEKLERNQVRIKVLGTGFFISQSGIFLTAKHVVDQYPDKKDNLSAMLLKKPNYKFANIIRLQLHPTIDAAIGLVDFSNESWEPPKFSLFDGVIKNNSEISSFGYSKTIQEFEKDKIKIQLNPEYFEKGFSIARWPVYQHNMSSTSGVSGGPVFLQANSSVFAICCTGFDPPPGGTCTNISSLLDWPINFVQDTWNTIRGIAAHRPDMIALIKLV